MARVTLTCAFCKETFSRRESKLKYSKSGLYFCTRSCKDIGSRLESGLKEIQPSHYGQAKKSYRKIAFRHLDRRCKRCGYDRCESALQVHHKDRNTKNNDVSNLEILCANCHEEEHHLRY